MKTIYGKREKEREKVDMKKNEMKGVNRFYAMHAHFAKTRKVDNKIERRKIYTKTISSMKKTLKHHYHLSLSLHV